MYATFAMTWNRVRETKKKRGIGAYISPHLSDATFPRPSTVQRSGPSSVPLVQSGLLELEKAQKARNFRLGKIIAKIEEESRIQTYVFSSSPVYRVHIGRAPHSIASDEKTRRRRRGVSKPQDVATPSF